MSFLACLMPLCLISNCLLLYKNDFTCPGDNNRTFSKVIYKHFHFRFLTKQGIIMTGKQLKTIIIVSIIIT